MTRRFGVYSAEVHHGNAKPQWAAHEKRHSLIIKRTCLIRNTPADHRYWGP